jgi:hypothetical protein
MARQNLENLENTGVFRQKLNDNFTELYSKISVDTAVRLLTGKYESSFTTVKANSAQWAVDTSIDTGVRSLTGDWKSVYTNVRNTSANWNSVYTNVQANSAQWAVDTSIDTGVRSLTGDWNSVYTNVQTNSAQWAVDTSIDTGVRNLTANYDSVYTNVQTNSAKWVLEDFIVACSDESTILTTTTSAVTFRVPFAIYLNSVRASVNVAPVGSTIIVDIKQTGTSIFSTKLSIDANEETSTTAATPAVISNPNLTDNAKVVVSIDQVGSSTAGSGLKITFKGYRL